MKPTPPSNPNHRGNRATLGPIGGHARPRPRLRVPTVTPGTPKTRRPHPTRATEADRPLRLVGVNEINEQHVADAADTARDARPGAQPAPPTPIRGATDPRWVLAVRTAESLQGDVLSPEKRERLMSLAKMMGLTPFDGCLVIAMIQDQARRGLLARHCPGAVEPQLAMIPLPRDRKLLDGLRERPGQVALLAAGILALQGLLVWMWLG